MVNMNFLKLIISAFSISFGLLACQKPVPPRSSEEPPRLSQELVNHLNDEAYGENDPVFEENQALDNYDPSSPESKIKLAQQLPDLAQFVFDRSKTNQPYTDDQPETMNSKTIDPTDKVDSQKVKKSEVCGRNSTWNCALHIIISKRNQRLYLESYGEPMATTVSNKVSTGTTNRPTPNYHGHPAGWPVEKRTSKKYPHGDWKGYGNMPYALPLGIPGYFIHGTASISKLGQQASHGCIRVNPYQMQIIYKWIIHYIKANSLGTKDIYLTIQDSWTPQPFDSHQAKTAAWSNQSASFSDDDRLISAIEIQTKEIIENHTVMKTSFTKPKLEVIPEIF